MVRLFAVCLTSIRLRTMLLPFPQGIAVGSVGLIKCRFEFACSLEEFVSTVLHIFCSMIWYHCIHCGGLGSCGLSFKCAARLCLWNVSLPL